MRTFTLVVLSITCPVLLAQPGTGLQIPTITEYGGVAGVNGVTAGPDGAVWFTERSSGKIGAITTSGQVAEFALPSPHSDPRIITTGPDGALWFTEGTGNKIGRITPSGVITEFAIPSPDASALGITTGPDGALWFAESNGSRSKIGRITVDGTISEFPLSPTRGPNMITAGRDGALWFTEYWGNKIGSITTTGAVTEFDIPTANSGPFGITAGPDGALWFTELNASTIGRITTAGVITEYPIPARASGITAGPDGALWFTESNTNKIGRITTTGTVSEFTSLTSGSAAEITVGPDGALWFGKNVTIGRVQLPKSRTGALSHIAAGGSWATVITLANTISVPVPVTVAFHDDQGSPMTLPVTITQQGVPQDRTASSIDVAIGANSIALISMGEQMASTQVGWAEILSSGPVAGFAIFRFTPPSGPASEGTVPLETQSPSMMILPYDNTGGFVTGVALANLSSTNATITGTIWDENGSQRGTSSIPIAGNGHTSFELHSKLPLTGGRRGIVRFQSPGTGGLAGLGLRFSPFATFTSLPTVR